MRTNSRRFCVNAIVVIAAFLNPGYTYAQSTTLKQLAELKGFKIGFELSPENLGEEAFLSTARREASVGTVTAYWYLPDGLGMDRGPVTDSLDSPSPRGKYNFSRPNSVASFCERAGIGIHGHALLWAQDQFNPPWVLQLPASKSRAVLENHIAQVVGKFSGRVETWHVVNEVFDYKGAIIDSYWSRHLGVPNAKAVTPEFMDIAFRAAASADPKAQLIYNDYGQEESDPRKFNAIRNMLVDMRRRGVPIHGMGWQLHQTVSTVLNPAFQLEDRMNAMADLGFDNYITELDIVMDARKLDGSLPDPKLKYSDEDFLQQKWAYKKVFEIFARVKRRVAAQTWGVSDKQSWLGANRSPLLFDSDFAKKPAYYGVQEALQGEISGLRTLQSPLSKRFLIASSSTEQNSPTTLLPVDPATLPSGGQKARPSSLPLWQITAFDGDGSYRLKAKLNNHYLRASTDEIMPPATTASFSKNDLSQCWYLISFGGGYFLVLNRENCLSLQQNVASLSKHLVVAGPRRTWWIGIWKIE